MGEAEPELARWDEWGEAAMAAVAEKELKMVGERLQCTEHGKASAGMMKICIPPRDTSPHQDSAGTAPSGTPPPAPPPPPPQTQGTQSHSAPTPLKRPSGKRKHAPLHDSTPSVLYMKTHNYNKYYWRGAGWR